MESLISFLETMPFWYWWVFAVGLLTIELITGSTYFLWPAIAAAIVGVFALFPFSLWQIELIVFAVTTTGLSIWAPRYVKPWIHKTQADHMNLNDRGAQKIGRKGSVWKKLSSMAQAKCVLAIRCGSLRARRGMDIEEGVQVEITRAEGTKLFVKSI